MLAGEGEGLGLQGLQLQAAADDGEAAATFAVRARARAVVFDGEEEGRAVAVGTHGDVASAAEGAVANREEVEP